ncbi:7-cyano-7-deazaguanine synthase QueC [Bacteroidetes/Chlorobi group bacterium ChocPot_Mid]|jgi:7-cyano-7-deazaguanine synthase|nr:MAG: 7-cyano-7-deazaguanine synthase QueC [Bacteroidetes/Chlorobi group bacterium ChocPot_Mid]
MKNKKAVVLMSGGMDSAVTTAIAIHKGFQVFALHLNYGQRTQYREKKAFSDLVKYFGISELLEVDVSYFSQIGNSSLTDKKIEITTSLQISSSDTQCSNEIPSSYVPFRNGNILAIATSWAETINANAIFIGAMQLDYSGYPDCRREFFDAFEQAINLGTKPETKLKIITPIINFTKKDVVLKGKQLGVPFELTWSCYKDEDKACGVCDSCLLRLRGFEQARIIDPIKYKK